MSSSKRTTTTSLVAPEERFRVGASLDGTAVRAYGPVSLNGLVNLYNAARPALEAMAQQAAAAALQAQPNVQPVDLWPKAAETAAEVSALAAASDGTAENVLAAQELVREALEDV